MRDPLMSLPENALRLLGAWEPPRARSLTWPLNALAIIAISAYQAALSKGLVPRAECRHYPSCSRYAILAFRRYRFLDAARRTRARVTECGVNSGRPFVDFP
jgi:putative component of membrane protein insertase Oxa1/YidC/SpoIIIJ protein YidD